MSTPNMGLTEPTDHGSTDVWGAALNAALDLIDAHDHTTGKGVKVPSAGLKINADVSWAFGGVNFAISDAKAIDFTPTTAASMTTYSSALFSNSSDSNNLYFRNSAGTNVQITSGSTLNISIVGGIGGDYASIGALLDYDDATDTYRFRQQTSASVRQYAKILAGDLRLSEYLAAGNPTVPTNFVTLKSPAALAASYTVQWLAALPASTLALQISSAGVLTATNTFASDLIATDFRFTTARVMNLGAASLMEASAGSHTKKLGASSSAVVGYTLAANTSTLVWPIPLEHGATVTGYTVYVRKRTNGSATIAARLWITTGTNGIEGTGGGSGSSNTANAPGFITLSESGLTTTTANSAEQIYLVFTPSGSVTTNPDELYHAVITYTRP